MAHRVAIIDGDGIGPEVVAQGLRVVAAAGVVLDTTPYDLGGRRYLSTGEVLPDDVLDELRTYDAIFLGAIGTPEVAPGVLERGLLLKVRTWGNAYGIALAATGRVDAFFDARVHPWDVAPAPVLMTEAGGCYTTLDGSGSLHVGNALLCGPGLLDPLLALLRG